MEVATKPAGGEELAARRSGLKRRFRRQNSRERRERGEDDPVAGKGEAGEIGPFLPPVSFST
jgi:hypothetical protein